MNDILDIDMNKIDVSSQSTTLSVNHASSNALILKASNDSMNFNTNNDELDIKMSTIDISSQPTSFAIGSDSQAFSITKSGASMMIFDTQSSSERLRVNMDILDVGTQGTKLRIRSGSTSALTITEGDGDTPRIILDTSNDILDINMNAIDVSTQPFAIKVENNQSSALSVNDEDGNNFLTFNTDQGYGILPKSFYICGNSRSCKRCECFVSSRFWTYYYISMGKLSEGHYFR